MANGDNYVYDAKDACRMHEFDFSLFGMAYLNLKGRTWERTALAGILILAAYLRLRGISFGLPDKYRPDEEYLVSHAVGIMAGNFNPGFFIYPSLSFYLLAAVYWLFGLVGSLYGLIENGTAQYFGENLFGPAHLIGRLLSAAFGVAGVWAVYRLGRELRGRSVGLLSALLAAVGFILARESHYATTDIIMTFFFTLSLVYCLKIFRRGNARSYCLCGLFAGLAVSSKYTAVVLAGPIAAASICSLLRNSCSMSDSIASRLRKFSQSVFSMEIAAKISLGALTAILFFALTSPYVFLDFNKFLADWAYQMPFLKSGLGIKMDYGWAWIWNFGLKYGLGDPFRWAFVLTAAFAVYEAVTTRFKKSEGLVLVAAIFSVCLVLAKSKWIFIRYTAPLIVPACVLAADCLLRIKGSARPGFALPILISGVLALSLDPFIRTLRHNELLARTDTRTLANDWINQNIQKPAKIAADMRYFYAKPQLRGGYSYVAFESAASLSSAEVPFALVDSHPISFFSPDLPAASAQLLASRWEKIVEFSPFDPDSKEVPVFDVEDAFYVPIAGFGAVVRPGAKITIYKAK